MPSLTRLICLANSRKHGAHCVAGIEPTSGTWLRPVSDLDDGRLTRDLRLVHGREPRLLEALRIPLAATGPDYGFEPENRSLLSGPWLSDGIVEPSEIARFCRVAPHILHTAERYVTVEQLHALPAERRVTLELVETGDFTVFHTGPSEYGGHKWYGTFSTAVGAELRARITDPVFAERLERGHRPSPRCLITVSLSMPFTPEGWDGEGTPCWKLIAAVIEMDGAPQTTVVETPSRAPDSSCPSDLRAALKKVFGFAEFRPNQESIVRAITEGRDTLAVMPTGSGKSLCYQLPACVMPGTCVVVSPLISLMKDQVDAASANGLRAACYNSSQGTSERLGVLRRLEAGRLDLLYISPERLGMEAFLNHLKRCQVSLFAIDEAHCISEWGHDFRPDYLFLGELVGELPHVPVAAFTATATREVQTDIVQRLGLRSPHLVRASFDRPNLFYEVVRKERVEQQIVELVRARPGDSGIVYRATRAAVEDTAALLNQAGVRALPYHAGLANKVRREHQEMFNRDRVEVVVATIAFGMGIDKSNIRFVVHGDLPKNLESYSQETGRAGRDGEPADCTLFYGGGDIPKIRHFIDRLEDEDERHRSLQKLHDMIAFASVNACRRRQLLAYFGETYRADNCGRCDVCCGNVERVEATTDAQIVMSAVARTEERFGAAMIVDIVTGANTRQVRQWHMDRVKTYGRGSDRPKKHWRHIIDELIAQQCIVRTADRHPSLKLTPKGKRVLFGREPFHASKTAESKPAASEHTHADRPGNAELFEVLRRLRLELAEERNVAPFVVFSDRSLREMTRIFPTSEEAMLAVTGVGEMKWRAYGPRFVDAIAAFLGSHPEIEPPVPAGGRSAARRAGRGAGDGLSATVEQTWQLLQNGLPPAEIAAHRGLTEGTIISHIERLMRAGRPVDFDALVSPPIRQCIEELFHRHGTEHLAPVVEASGNTISYKEASLVRAWLACSGDKSGVDRNT